jgi:hypothetical protein
MTIVTIIIYERRERYRVSNKSTHEIYLRQDIHRHSTRHNKEKAHITHEVV